MNNECLYTSIYIYIYKFFPLSYFCSSRFFEFAEKNLTAKKNVDNVFKIQSKCTPYVSTAAARDREGYYESQLHSTELSSGYMR
jgi:hypothetical protein